MAEAKDEAGGRALVLQLFEKAKAAQRDDALAFQRKSALGESEAKYYEGKKNALVWVLYDLEHVVIPALSAPTAESGKDRQAFVDFAATVPAPEVTVLAGDPSSEPVPVAEVTRKHSETAIRGAVAVLREEWRSNDGAEGDSVRVVCVLTQLTALRECYERDVAALQSNLTDANLKAEGLRVDNEELRRELERRIADAMDTDAKLAESERKLGEAEEGIANATEEARFYLAQREKLANWQRSVRTSIRAGQPGFAALDQANAEEFATEPAGVEAGKSDGPKRIHQRAADEAALRASDNADPTPTEPEAPARFRVGQRVKRAANITNGDGTVTRLVRNERGFNNWVKWDNGGECNYQDRELEPADPAPPKPGGEVLTRAELVKAIRAVVSGTADFCNGKMLALAKELEREGGGKS